jgi:hypothetical protein
MKSITSKNLAISSLCISLTLVLIDEIKQKFKRVFKEDEVSYNWVEKELDKLSEEC